MSRDIPTPPPSYASSSSSEQERRRRRRRVIDSSEESDLSVSSDLRQDTYTRYRYRIGAPALKRLPLTTSDESDNQVIRFQQSEVVIRQLLQNTRVQFRDIELVRRIVPEDVGTEAGDRTVLIEAIWTDDNCFNTWMNAVGRIRRFLRQTLDTQLIKVEIIAPDLTIPRCMGAIESGHRLVAAWSRLQPIVLQILDGSNTSLAPAWIAVDPIRLGPPSDLIGVDLPVIISILVDWSCDPNYWERARKDIDQLLSSNGFPEVHAEFEHGEVFGASPFVLRAPSDNKSLGDLRNDTYTQQVKMGDDIGAARYFESVPSNSPMRGGYGTFGGYLTIQKTGQQSMKVGVTNYHVVRKAIPGIVHEDSGVTGESAVERAPRVGELLSKIDKNGFGSRHEARPQMILESPARRKHNAMLYYLDQQLQENREAIESAHSIERDSIQRAIPALQTAFQERQNFFEDGKHILGTAMIGSGLVRRTSDNHRLDWALIEMEANRIGSNIIPEVHKWPGDGSTIWQHQRPLDAVCGKLMQGKVSLKRLVRQAEQGDFLGKRVPPFHSYLYKVGARTNHTYGEFSHVKHNTRWSEHDKRFGLGHSTEYCFVQVIVPPPASGSIDSFSLNGDSGAFCINYLGQWAGQIWGGSTRQRVGDKILTYVTDQEDIIKSIEGLLNMREGGWEVDLPND